MLLNCVLEKILESPLDCKEIQPVYPKGDQPWVFTGRTDAEAEVQIFGHLRRRTDSLERPWCWERLRAGGEGDNRGWDAWRTSMTRWTSIWANSNGHQFEQTLGDSEGQGCLVCCSPWGCQRVGHNSDWTTTVTKCGVNCVFSFL